MKESTAQWVSRAFGTNKEDNATSVNNEIVCDDLAKFVTTTQSCQEALPTAQDTDTGNVKLGNLWSDQVEEFSEEEGEIQDDDE